MSPLVDWLKFAALVWAGAMLAVLLSEIRFLQRLIPDWLRNLSRVIVLVGTIGALTLAVLFGVRFVTSSLEARPEGGDGIALDLLRHQRQTNLHWIRRVWR